jgi:2-dehydro-3-deoxyphosphooctonate aldolase (KDO 8-P synthase)
MSIAAKLKEIEKNLKAKFPEQNLVFVFKASYDKANRSSINGFRGPGIKEGLEILAKVRERYQLPIVSDVHDAEQATIAGEVLDILQIPAFLCRQTDLISAAAKTGKVLNIKKGQFLSPAEVGNIRDKCKEAGNSNLFICERGSSFGYNNLVVDMRSFEQIRQLGIRTIFDATHSCQLPGAGGDKSLGNSEFAPILARAAVAAGATGIFAETHPKPSTALSDGPNMIPLDLLETALESILAVRAVVVPKVIPV